MEADTTYHQTSEAETEICNSDDSNYAEMTDENYTRMPNYCKRVEYM